MDRLGWMNRGHGFGCWWALGIAALLSCAPRVAAADLILRTRVTSSERAEPSEITHYWTARHLVEDMPKARILADLEARTIAIIDKQAKTYSLWTFDEFQRIGAEAARKLADTRERLAAMPADKRPKVPAMVRGMMGLGDPGPNGFEWAVRSTGAREKLAGYEAEESSISVGLVEGIIWAAPSLHPPFKPGDLAAFRAAAGESPRFGLNPLDPVPGVDGVLLRTRTTLPGRDGISVAMEVTEVLTQAPPAEMIEIPPGYERTTPPATPAATPSAAPPGAPL